MKKKTEPIKWRNEHAVAAKFRTSAGPMGKSKKAQRRADKMSLKKDMNQ